MAEINVEMLREKLYRVAKALFYIGETCVDASKSHISERDALDKIRKYLYDTDIIGSRLRVDQLIEDCAEPFVTNTFQEPDIDWLKEALHEMPLQTFRASFPPCCDGCSNNPKNGGSGICNCTLPYMQNPTTYTVPSEDWCMVNNIEGNVFFADNLDKLNEHKADANIVADAVERTKKYIKV